MLQPLRFRQLRRIVVLFWLSALLFAGGTSATTKKPPLQPININAAGSEELQQVPGIGPATADKILQMRKSYGAFKSVDDLLAIRGIGKKRLDKMRKYLTAGKPPSATAKKPAEGQNITPTAKPAKLSAPVSPPPKKASPATDSDNQDEEPD